MRPGVDVITSGAAPPQTALTDTGVAFVIGDTAKGPDTAVVGSISQFVATFGDRVAPGIAVYDAADVFFHEGGANLRVARTNPGVGGLFMLEGREVEPEPQPEPEPAPKASTKEEGAQVTPLVAGPTLVAALGKLTKDMGPGQVFIADPAIASVLDNQLALLAHCAAANRVALLSAPQASTSAALIAAAAALKADPNARFGALFAPFAIVPGVVTGTTRTVPSTALVAGIIARNDASFSANQPAAGVLGQAVWALDLATRYTDQEYADLNTGGVCMSRIVFGGVRVYGFRSLVDPATVPQWLEFNWSRLAMAIQAQAAAIGENYVFAQIDGRGKMIAQFGGELTAMLARFYDRGALYGQTSDDAFQVNVSAAVNTPVTIANGELHAVLRVKMSPAAEWVVIEIVKVATTENLAPQAAAAA